MNPRLATTTTLKAAVIPPIASMSTDEFRAILDDFKKLYGINQEAMGDLLDVDQRTLRRWREGETQISRVVAMALRAARVIGLGAFTKAVAEPGLTF